MHPTRFALDVNHADLQAFMWQRMLLKSPPGPEMAAREMLCQLIPHWALIWQWLPGKIRARVKTIFVKEKKSFSYHSGQKNIWFSFLVGRGFVFKDSGFQNAFCSSKMWLLDERQGHLWLLG